MTDLADFLLARIAEDEEWQRREDCDCAIEGFPLRHGAACPVKVLAECEAKRRITEGEQGHLVPNPDVDQPWTVSDDGVDWVEYRMTYDGTTERLPSRQFVEQFFVAAPPSRTLRLLAVPYADHPDYRQEWKL